jgi:hypothetical protein
LHKRKTMTCRGIVKGKLIELESPLPFFEGQAVSVSVEAVSEAEPLGSPARILRAMREPPHVTQDDVDEFERSMNAGRIPVRQSGLFDRES